MRKNSLRRVLATVASASLVFAGFAATSAPAQAADPVTHFRIHINVPASVAAQWNIWWWGVSNAGGTTDNTLGESTQTINGTAVTKDFTPNFTNDDAYGSYADFDLPGTLTALNNVMRTTESWNGQAATPAVLDDPNTPDVDESAPALPAIDAADKPFGGDNIFPAGESWWNIGTGKQEFPLKDTVDYKIHVNMPLATAQANGWSVWTWGPYTPAQTATLASVKTVTTVTKVVKKKKVTTKVTSYPYKGKVPADLVGVPFTGSDKYGAFAVVKLPRIYVQTLGFLVKRSDATHAWNDPTKTIDFKPEHGNAVAAGSTESWIQLGASYITSNQPAYTSRLTATATYSNGTITVTPVYPSAPSLRGAYPDSILVTAKKGATSKTCTITNTVNAAGLSDASWNLAGSCDITGITVPSALDGDATWEISIQGTSTVTGKAAPSASPAAKILVAHS
jgi:hypothetical protein